MFIKRKILGSVAVSFAPATPTLTPQNIPPDPLIPFHAASFSFCIAVVAAALLHSP
jgi:hypothetical protein